MKGRATLKWSFINKKKRIPLIASMLVGTHHAALKSTTAAGAAESAARYEASSAGSTTRGFPGAAAPAKGREG